MNKILRCLLSISLLTSTITYCPDNSNCCASNTCSSCDTCGDCNCCSLGKCEGYPYLQIRSQGKDAARQISGVQQFINRYDMDSTYGLFSITPEYSQSFQGEKLAQFLFGSDLVNCKELYIQGSQVNNRNSNAWLADYFGLPTDFQSKITFCPKIQNAILDFNFYLGLDELVEGLYFRMNFPLVYTKWQLSPCEKVVNSGTNDFAAGYMSTETISRKELEVNFLSTMNGSYQFGDMQSPIKAGRFVNKCDDTKTRMAAVDLQLGWNLVSQQDYHFGLLLLTSVPTGNAPSSTFIFEPIVGNGKHWEFGVGMTSSWIFHRSEENPDRYIGLWLDANVSHLFKSCQCRSFDFCGKPNSRYMLLEQMSTNSNDIKAEIKDELTPAEYQYHKNLIPAINWSTFSVDVRIDVQAEAVAKIGFLKDNWNFDLGYNFWARSGERFCDNKCGCDDTKTYAIKGDTFIYGAARENGVQTTIFPLSASQSLANIHTGKNYPAINNDDPKTNPRIDNPYLAQSGDLLLYVIDAQERINTSINPVKISRKDLNLSKSPSSISNSLFSNLGYAWKEKEDDYVPFLTIGGKIEFAQNNCDDCCDSDCEKSCESSSSCNSCSCSSCSCSDCKTTKYCDTKSCDTKSCSSNCENSCPRGGVSTWGIWIKGGLAFD